MYYYKKDFDYSVEDMIKDFINFKRIKDGPETIQINSFNLYTQDEKDRYDNYNESTKALNNVDWDNKGWLPKPINETIDELELDMNYSKEMLSEIPKTIQTYIEKTVDRMDYEGSPIYGDYITKEEFNQMVDTVYQDCLNAVNELGDVLKITTQNIYWGKDRLLRGLIEPLLLHEIYGRRRPYFRHRRHRHYYKGHYPHRVY